MKWPLDIIGWIRTPDNPIGKGIEVRLRHEPNLFQPSAYRITSIRDGVIPLIIYFDVQVIPILNREGKGYVDKFGYIIKVGDLVDVDYIPSNNGFDYCVWNKVGGFYLRLKKKPANIR